MKASTLIRQMMENSKGTKTAPGELSKPTYAKLGTPDNHVDGKRQKEVDGKKGLGQRKDQKPKADVGTIKNRERRKTRMIQPSSKKVSEGMKFDKAPVKDEMGRPAVKKEKPAKQASVRSAHPDHQDPKADVGKPDLNKGFMQARTVAVKRIEEGLSEIESLLGQRLGLDEAFLASDEGEDEQFSYDTDRMGGVEIVNNRTGASVYLQPGEDAREFLDQMERAEDNGVSPDKIQWMLSQYAEVMEGEDGKSKRPFRTLDKHALVAALPSGATARKDEEYIVRRLAERGLVEIVSDDSPDGSVDYVLTPKGKPVAQQMKEREESLGGKSPIGEYRRGEGGWDEIDIVMGRYLDGQDYLGRTIEESKITECGCGGGDELDGIMDQFGFGPSENPDMDTASYAHEGGDTIAFTLSDGSVIEFTFYRHGKPVEGGRNPDKLERMLYNMFGGEMTEDKKRGLWDNVWAKRRRGEKPARPGDKDYPSAKAWKKTTKEETGALAGMPRDTKKSPDYGTEEELVQHFMTKRPGWTAPDGTTWYIKLYDGVEGVDRSGIPSRKQDQEYYAMKNNKPVMRGPSYKEIAQKIAQAVFKTNEGWNDDSMPRRETLKRIPKHAPMDQPVREGPAGKFVQGAKKAAKDMWYGAPGTDERRASETKHARNLMKKGHDRMDATRMTRDKFGESAYLMLAGDLLEWHSNGVPYVGEIVEFIGNDAVVTLLDGTKLTRRIDRVSEAEVMDDEVRIDEKKKKSYNLKAKDKSDKGGLTDKGRKAYNSATGSNLKRPQPEGGARRTSYCARSKGQQDDHNIDCRKDPDKRICKARRRWNC